MAMGEEADITFACKNMRRICDKYTQPEGLRFAGKTAVSLPRNRRLDTARVYFRSNGGYFLPSASRQLQLPNA